ncbi:hypothetical protein SAMN05216378_3233 [Paenibacillus catalpae]|uniref:Spore coat protein n=1 Tax=Paenibacillus catalpae TaxID=1045775 RepID=A0A1I2AT36_9BACL|nr:hypothetical protein [Paenibacillus catalpae]SFE47141.1 hypothetical protein SAMN05216378_3233 [Paenibacillus catalpae]
MLQALTAKELEYIADSMSNEDLLIKQNALLASLATNPALRQAGMAELQTHQQHYQTLLQALQQHQHLAPTQPQ